MYWLWLPHDTVCNAHTIVANMAMSLRMLSLHTVSSVFANELYHVYVCLPG